MIRIVSPYPPDVPAIVIKTRKRGRTRSSTKNPLSRIEECQSRIGVSVGINLRKNLRGV